MQTLHESGWFAFVEPRPYVAVIGFAYDQSGMFPILKRSNLVRSAKNAMSLPSGLHEPGFSLGQQFCNELKEELNLVGILSTAKSLFVYENISREDKWHWVLFGMSVQVVSLSAMVNVEPDKHSEVKPVSFSEFMEAINDPSIIWTPGLRDAVIANRDAIKSSISSKTLL